MAEEVLVQFRDQFISDMDADAVVHELLDKHIIDKGDKNRIAKKDNPEQQNQILHLALKEKCTDEALMEACDIIIAVKNRKMTALAEAMKEALVARTGLAPTPAPGARKQAALPFSVSAFLKRYEREFLKVVNAKHGLARLKGNDVIPASLKKQIEEEVEEEDARYLLFEHLEKNATLATLRAYCDVASTVGGYPQMKELVTKMKDALPA